MLRRFMVASALSLACLALEVPSAFAQNDGDQGQNEQGRRPRHRSVPEFDPLTVGAIAAVVAGGGVLIARRRKR